MHSIYSFSTRCVPTVVAGSSPSIMLDTKRIHALHFLQYPGALRGIRRADIPFLFSYNRVLHYHFYSAFLIGVLWRKRTPALSVSSRCIFLYSKWRVTCKKFICGIWSIWCERMWSIIWAFIVIIYAFFTFDVCFFMAVRIEWIRRVYLFVVYSASK